MEECTSKFYSVDQFKERYSSAIIPIEDQIMWPKLPYPKFVVMKSGRRAEDRRRGPKEGRKKAIGSTCVRCKLCKLSLIHI